MSQNPQARGDGPEYTAYNTPPANPSPQADEAFLNSYGRTPPPPPKNPYATPPGPQSAGSSAYGQAPGPYEQYGPYGPPQSHYGVVQRPMYQPSQLSGNMSLNYWLSAFFGIVPALIFYLVDKDKHPLHDAHLKAVLNFSITRAIVSLFAFIPFIGWFIVVGYFVVAIVGAVSGTSAYRQGRGYHYPGSFRFLN